MLVISRTAGTAILIGDALEVGVTSVGPEAATLRLVRKEIGGRLTTEVELSPRLNDSMDFGDGCTCTVVDIRGEKVRLGFDVPKTVSLHRKEIWESIRRNRWGNQ